MSVRRTISIGEDELEGMLLRAAKQGANEVLLQLGLHDKDDPAKAATDIKTLRDLLAAWRDIQKSAVKGVFQWFANLLGLALVIGLAVIASKGGFSLKVHP